ncbi:hypothetical protein [Rhodococcus sp. H29-C3]|uniref:hypothetical protein n=1 Tax=Rhodococcus sp. H29-C3 TaxID=3046307 RepID=UPI0024BAC9E4|nr:hypothetical protein [Rhodococcus sp. H29-C3]MDJ0363339.1 hypothetical protein [Rhodococcus sp. H29-C3]
MDRYLAISSAVVYLGAVMNLIAANYYHYRYAVGSSKNAARTFRIAQFHWFAGAAFLIAATVIAASRTSSSPTLPLSVVLPTIAVAILAPSIPLIYLLHTRNTRRRKPSLIEQIAADDTTDRIHH